MAKRLIKICVVQSLFIPDKSLYKKSINSLESLSNLKNTEYIEYDFYFIGYFNDYNLDKYINEYNPIKYIDQKYNYGKSFNINYILNNINIRQYDFILSIDGDIIFKENIDYSKEIYDIIEMDNIGIVAFDQTINSCHLYNHLLESFKYNKHTFKYNKNGGGIAGGAILISTKSWISVNGYRVMGVYAGDDGFLFKDILNKGFLCLLSDIEIIHPHEININYQTWKINKCNINKNLKNEEELKKESENTFIFWNREKLK